MITSNVTVKLGVRYQVQFWPELYPRDRNDVAPRLSVAWDPGGEKTSVLRAAYGVYYDNSLDGNCGQHHGVERHDGRAQLRCRLAVLSSNCGVERARAPRDFATRGSAERRGHGGSGAENTLHAPCLDGRGP